jgi:hypothetical protein
LPTKDQKPAYEIHDYSAVESYMRAQSERRELSNQAIIKSAAAHRLKYVALVIASCGFAALLVLYGVSLLNEEKIRTVEKKIIIERSNNEKPSIQRQLKELEETDKKSSRLHEKPDLKNKNKKSKDTTDVVTMFTIFKRVPSRIYGFENVVTGHRYPNSKTKYPESQYCYVQVKSSGLETVQMNLGRKEGRGNINWHPYNLVSSHEISPSQFESAKSDCQFK